VRERERERERKKERGRERVCEREFCGERASCVRARERESVCERESFVVREHRVSEGVSECVLFV
jgi:hypothetical protein